MAQPKIAYAYVFFDASINKTQAQLLLLHLTNPFCCILSADICIVVRVT